MRIAGTVVACDASGAAELAFVSHAAALPIARGGAAHKRGRLARIQVLTTPETLTLMGARGQRLRSRALSPGIGRPFTLGFLRLELVSAGHQTGAASLLCDSGASRILYAGVIRLGPAEDGLPAGELRRCDALCIDAAFADPRFVFLPRAEADARVLEFAAAARGSGASPVFFAAPLGPAQDTGRALSAAGWKLRGDHAVLEANARYQQCGVTVPPVGRFAGRLLTGEALLWSRLPPARGTVGGAPELAQVRAMRTAWVSEWAGDPTAVTSLGIDAGICVSRRAGLADVLAYIEASGAKEVALMHAPSDALAAELRRRRVDSYPIGPPRQIGLFDSPLP